jgi:hypothetical protein
MSGSASGHDKLVQAHLEAHKCIRDHPDETPQISLKRAPSALTFFMRTDIVRT